MCFSIEKILLHFKQKIRTLKKISKYVRSKSKLRKNLNLFYERDFFITNFEIFLLIDIIS